MCSVGMRGWTRRGGAVERTIISRVITLVLQAIVIAGQVGDHVIVRVHICGGSGDWSWGRALCRMGSCGRSPLVGMGFLGSRG